jgi:hypothetical protein
MVELPAASLHPSVNVNFEHRQPGWVARLVLDSAAPGGHFRASGARMRVVDLRSQFRDATASCFRHQHAVPDLPDGAVCSGGLCVCRTFSGAAPQPGCTFSASRPPFSSRFLPPIRSPASYFLDSFFPRLEHAGFCIRRVPS